MGRHGRGRPLTFDPDEALAAALRTFWSFGYEGASLERLTRAMRIQRPSLYNAFGSKEKLFRKALDLYFKEHLGYLSDALTAPTSEAVARALLAGAACSYTARMTPRGCLVVTNTLPGGPPLKSLHDEIVARYAIFERHLTNRFELAQSAGELPPETCAAALAELLMTVVQGMAVKAASGATHGELRRIADAFLSRWPRSSTCPPLEP